VINWKDALNYDPIPALQKTDNKAIYYFIKRDLLREDVSSVKVLWDLPSALKILKKQDEAGYWKYPGKIKEEWNTQEDYNQIETFRQIGYLIQKYGFNKKHLAIQKAAEFLFSKQTEEGDFRGIYSTQYSPNYSAMILELLMLAGYEFDPRSEKCLDWLLTVRQNDGGWALSQRTLKMTWQDAFSQPEPLETDRSKPHAHLITGAVLRSFAIHPSYQKREEIQLAGKLLIDRFFENDKYADKKDKSHWTKFTFPFWFNDLISALITVMRLEFSRKEPKIQEALDWFIDQQKDDGSWNVKVLRPGGDKDIQLWMTLNICRIIKNFYS
jgi:hypothetical protein